MKLTAKNKVMLTIIEKCQTLENLARYIEEYAEEYGEDMREFFVATLWETYHTISA